MGYVVYPKATSTNIYNSDGTLDAKRTVTQAGFDMIFTGGGFGIGASTLSGKAHIIGTGTTTATRTLYLENSTGSSFTYIDDAGRIICRSVGNIVSQFENITGANDFWFTGNLGTQMFLRSYTAGGTSRIQFEDNNGGTTVTQIDGSAGGYSMIIRTRNLFQMRGYLTNHIHMYTDFTTTSDYKTLFTNDATGTEAPESGIILGVKGNFKSYRLQTAVTNETYFDSGDIILETSQRDASGIGYIHQFKLRHDAYGFNTGETRLSFLFNSTELIQIHQSGDMKFMADSIGPLLIDRSDASVWRLYINAGTLSVESV